MLEALPVVFILLMYVFIGIWVGAKWESKLGLDGYEQVDKEVVLVCIFWPIFVTIAIVGGIYYAIKRLIKGN